MGVLSRVLVCRADKKAVRKTITAQNEPDLFFGFRGAGGALGVAIAYTTATFPIPPNVRPKLVFSFMATPGHCRKGCRFSTARQADCKSVPQLPMLLNHDPL